MTQEEKNLLLRDLSARLSYGVKCCVKNNYKNSEDLVGIVGENISLFSSRCSTFNINVVRPYLRPLSSMTEEEVDEFTQFDVYGNGEYIMPNYETIDWLNAHHFDYRGLIPMGLAIEAPEGMYN